MDWGSYDGARYTERNGATCVTVAQKFLGWSEFFVHHGNIWLALLYGIFCLTITILQKLVHLSMSCLQCGPAKGQHNIWDELSRQNGARTANTGSFDTALLDQESTLLIFWSFTYSRCHFKHCFVKLPGKIVTIRIWDACCSQTRWHVQNSLLYLIYQNKILPHVTNLSDTNVTMVIFVAFCQYIFEIQSQKWYYCVQYSIRHEPSSTSPTLIDWLIDWLMDGWIDWLELSFHQHDTSYVRPPCHELGIGCLWLLHTSHVACDVEFRHS